MSEKTNLRQADTKVEVVGIVSENTLEESVRDGKKVISGDITVQTGDINFVTFRVYVNEKKNDGFLQKKNAAISKKITTLSKSYSVLPDTSYLPSFSTLAISSAVALTIRMPVSLISSRSASSCRRLVSFPAGLSKRNWSTDIL